MFFVWYFSDGTDSHVTRTAGGLLAEGSYLIGLHHHLRQMLYPQACSSSNAHSQRIRIYRVAVYINADPAVFPNADPDPAVIRNADPDPSCFFQCGSRSSCFFLNANTALKIVKITL